MRLIQHVSLLSRDDTDDDDDDDGGRDRRCRTWVTQGKQRPPGYYGSLTSEHHLAGQACIKK